MEFDYDGPGLGKGGTARLFVDGEQVGEGAVARDGGDDLLGRRHLRRRQGGRRPGRGGLPGPERRSRARSAGSRSTSATAAVDADHHARPRRAAPRRDGAAVTRPVRVARCRSASCSARTACSCARACTSCSPSTPSVEVVARRRRSSTRCARPASEQQPDVVLTDIRMPPTNTDEGIRLAAELRDSHPRDRRRRPQPVRRPDLRARAARARLGPPRLPAQGARPQPRRADGRDPRRRRRRLDDRPEDRRGARARPQPRGALAAQRPDGARARGARARSPRARATRAIAESLFLTKRAVEKHINAIFLKLGLADADDVSKRVKAALMFLADVTPPVAR